MNKPEVLLERLLPYGAIAVMVGAIVIWSLKQFLGEYLKKSGASAFDRSRRHFSRGAKFRRNFVRNYAEVVERDFGRHSLGFVADRVININELYVPLQYERDGERQDVYDNIRDHRCSVVLGPAGAGKSLLLKNSMLMWARRAQTGQTERVPVLIELHRCNGTTDSLVDLVIAEMVRSGIDKNRPRRRERIQELVLEGLKGGALSLLLDGLDEVGRSDRQRVLAELRDFARQYRECQFVVTCRDAAFQGQPLGDQFAHVVRVAEFDDAAVIRFMRNWKGLESASARGELFASLRNNPSLMRLARSPLLLTMIAYLHTEVFAKSGRRLPTSRAAFYQEAITHMLGRDADLGRAGSITTYEVGEKLSVLQRVALTSMESAGVAVDRLTVSRRTLEGTTRNLLPDLNLDLVHTKPLLDEIVDRSQLLVAVNKRRSHYVFRHLTLQEYLAAVELADNPDALLERYRADSLGWRETVKLWCGATTRDSTKVIAEIFASNEPQHKILALECLAEVKRVDTEFANVIIGYFLQQLGVDSSDRAAIVAALGVVAADDRPRGREVLRKLTRIAMSGSSAKVDAMQALSASGRPEAAQTLAPRANADEHGRLALRGMGELALPVLIARATEGFPWAVDDLAVVGTPAAAGALVELLWVDNSTAIRAAWRLAELLQNPDVEEELRQTSSTESNSSIASWIWRPFAAGKDDPLLRTAGRIGWLLNKSDTEHVPSDIVTIDPRLAIPLALEAVREVRPLQRGALMRAAGLPRRVVRPGGEISQLERIFANMATQPGPDEKSEEILNAVKSACALSMLQRRLVGMLSWPAQVALYRTLVFNGRVSISGTIRSEDWMTVTTPRRESGRLWTLFGVAYGAIFGGVFLLGYIRAALSLLGVWQFESKWLCFIAGASLLIFIGSVYLEYRGVFRGSSALVFSWAVSLVLALLASLWIGGRSAIKLLSEASLVGILLLLVAGGALGMIASHRDRVNDNPFRRCLEAEAVRLSDRTSIVAN